MRNQQIIASLWDFTIHFNVHNVPIVLLNRLTPVNRTGHDIHNNFASNEQKEITNIVCYTRRIIKD